MSSAAPTGARHTLLVVDDEAVGRRLVTALFRAEGYEVLAVETGGEALARFGESRAAAVILDLRLPDIDGLEVLQRLKATSPITPVILLTAHADVPSAVRAIQLGAYQYLTKPIHNDELAMVVRRAIERRQLETEVEALRRRVDGALARLMGSSDEVKLIADQVKQVADSGVTVLIEGETGTGKELVAHAIHEQSARLGRPFIALDCGAIPETLLESTLFGHERGAFSGAERRYEGHFRLAERGSLFLDEVANLPLPMQAKLLRVLQERTVRSLGGTRSIPLDVRFIAAANRSLFEEVRAGRFRQDLYYRLAEFTISLPPLRARRGDIPILARRFVEEAAAELRRPVCDLTEGALEALGRHSWPGNVRELRNVVRQAVLRAPAFVITTEQVWIQAGAVAAEAAGPSAASSQPAAPPSPRSPPSDDSSLREISERAVAQAERSAIIAALRRSGGNKSVAARALQTDYKTLHVKVKRYGISADDYGAS
jgi:DNA-binding NtrC family response regulator